MVSKLIILSSLSHYYEILCLMLLINKFWTITQMIFCDEMFMFILSSTKSLFSHLVFFSLFFFFAIRKEKRLNINYHYMFIIIRYCIYWYFKEFFKGIIFCSLFNLYIIYASIMLSRLSFFKHSTSMSWYLI